jgi:hypothetical protein
MYILPSITGPGFSATSQRPCNRAFKDEIDVDKGLREFSSAILRPRLSRFFLWLQILFSLKSEPLNSTPYPSRILNSVRPAPVAHSGSSPFSWPTVHVSWWWGKNRTEMKGNPKLRDKLTLFRSQHDHLPPPTLSVSTCWNHISPGPNSHIHFSPKATPLIIGNTLPFHVQSTSQAIWNRCWAQCEITNCRLKGIDLSTNTKKGFCWPWAAPFEINHTSDIPIAIDEYFTGN